MTVDMITSATGFVEVSATPENRIFYSIDGPLDGSRPILLFSNSLAASTHLWDESVEIFKSGYTIVRYDARFHGKSPLSSDPNFDYVAGHTMEELADDVLKLLDHLHIQQARAIIGLSIGAAVGLIFGAKYPERVQRVLVVGTRATSNPDSNAAHATRIKYGYANGSHALGQQSIARWFDADWAAAHPDRIAHAEEVYCKQSIEGYEASIAALRVLNLFPYAEDIGRRSDGNRFVFVAGELDGTVPRESRELAEKTGSEVVVIPGSGHISNIQLPDEFHDVVRRALVF
ncbi:Alpha/Beta hydrolase protein [Hypoxylon rubiginosum]|uniref:Alpha/Beta hydrolase protein n=1 Tax=Hypoxylon rubiginosum TaxID=110542 RepID=A0ACC0CMF3_9PEZI|nr:Alpha/Beta hydrolase protein [Hypoxylon rubiginosum]